MKILGLCVIIQSCLLFGMGGLLWPDKLAPIFEVLIFPWPATCRAIRANSLAAIGMALLLFVTLLVGVR